MQMEPWRKRGFVPDSDEDDGLDSTPDTDKSAVEGLDEEPDLEYITLPPTDPDLPQPLPTQSSEARDATAPSEDAHNVEIWEGSQELGKQISSPSNNITLRQVPDFDKTNAWKQTPSEEALTNSRRRARTYGKRHSAAQPTEDKTHDLQVILPDLDHDIWDIPSSPAAQSRFHHQAEKQRASLNTARVVPSSEPRAIGSFNSQTRQPSSRSSSPDELAFIIPPSRVTATQIPAEDENTRPRKSPTTASFLNSRPLGSEPNLQDAEPPRQDFTEQFPLVRRAFRERNAIQLHPYALEMAKYQRLMQERGIRPVRTVAATEKGSRNEATDESQEQDDFNPANLCSSPPPEEFIQPRKTSRRDDTGRAPQQHRANDHRKLAIQRSSSQKRRKTTHSTSNHGIGQTPGNSDRPNLVVSVDSTPRVQDPRSPFDNSPSQARNLVSSLRTLKSLGQRELTPPTTMTISVDSDSGEIVTPIARGDQSNAKNTYDIVSLFDNDDIFDSDESHQSFTDHEEEPEDRLIRDLQKKTRGVLPASWVRLNAEQTSDRQAAQRARRELAISRTEGKGVAKKISRKLGSTPGAQTQSSRAFFDLGDAEETENESSDHNQSVRNPVSRKSKIDRQLGQRVQRNNFSPVEGDDMEDNRIDYMLAPMSRRESGPGPARGLKRVKSKESADQKERRLKRARLQRQTRLTDSSYGGRRTERSSPRVSRRRGILDALDVADRPRAEQPQFLRVAARRARARRDQGRQSPTQKFVQLSSRQDTIDANQSLRDWKRGAIPRSKTSKVNSESRKPQGAKGLQGGRRNLATPAQGCHITKHFKRDTPEHVSNTDMLPSPNEPSAHARSIATESAPPAAENVNGAPSAQAAREGRQWVVERRMPIISLRRSDPRPAPTSLAAPIEAAPPSKQAFSRSLHLINRSFRSEKASRPFKSSLTLDRYITDKGSPASGNLSGRLPLEVDTNSINAKPAPLRRAMKKQNPTRLDIESDEYLQSENVITALPDDIDSDSPTITHVAPTSKASFNVAGIFNWQRQYPIDFDVQPLREGTFFHESTFIGSGELTRSFHVLKRDLDTTVGFTSIVAENETFHWGPWNELTSTQMGVIFANIAETVQRHASSVLSDDRGSGLLMAAHAYRSIIDYVTTHLSFIDPVDRIGFTSRATALVSSLQDSVAASIAGRVNTQSGLVRIACYNAVFANQIRQMSIQPSIVNQMTHSVGTVENLIKLSSADSLALVMSDSGMVDIRRFVEEHNTSAQRETGLRDQYPAVEAFVILKMLFRNSDALGEAYHDLQNDALIKYVVHNDKNIAHLEAGWRRLFSLLPFNDFDDHGIVRRKTRSQFAHDNWMLVKRLVSPVLASYGTCSAVQPISFNLYCRAIFQRCHRLINRWAWRECRPVLDTLYDFFAQNKLYNLKLEESRGSPSFLDQLDQSPSLEPLPGEPCFHTLLKIIASGLRFLAERYDPKKVRNFAWRLLPNHGRVFPKEKQLLREDLDALRNHHDLLCTLYWVIPAGLRFRIEIIKDIVHPASSHNETCTINLRAWARLVRFKLSTNENLAELEPFATWHAFFLSELRQQHSLARKEGESLGKTGEHVSRQLIEANIANNQRPIENLLSVALNGMQSAMERAHSLEQALRLIAKTPFDSLLGLFNPKQARVNAVVSDALKVIVAYINKDAAVSAGVQMPKSAPVVAPQPEDDSQEFEDVDWDESLDDAVTAPNQTSEGVDHVQNVLHSAVFRLLSNCFGEDQCPEDSILTDIVDCWTSVAQIMVFHQLRQWDNYLDPVSVESWASLRDTIQTRKFTPRFLAACIEKDKRILKDSRVLVTSAWIASLVERTSMLKFQHRLTEAILNCKVDDPLLQNLPFAVEKKSNRYTISLEDMSQRRVSLLSSLLSNMRGHILRLEVVASPDMNVVRHDYSEILRRLMMAMRSNYQELGSGPDGNAHGAYVEFVHRIITYLQELTSDIRPVDPFFTDPAVFPLPSSDPRYVVAKLKRYEPKLSSSKELQTLAVFIQSIVERATMDGQQDQLVGQLHSAMRESYESGTNTNPTLRAVLLQCVFPAYIELMFSTTTAWLLSMPLLKSVSLVFDDLLFSMDTTDSLCVSSILCIFNSVFHSVSQALGPFTSRPSKLQEPTTIIMLTVLVDMISSSLSVIDYVDRVTDAADSILSYIDWFRDFFVAVSALQAERSLDAAVSGFSILPMEPPPHFSANGLSPQLATARRFAFDDHRLCLGNWSHHDGKYYYNRSGHDPKLVNLEPTLRASLEDVGAVRLDLQDAVSDFVARVKQFDLLSK
ncbi:hypothetical protein N7539_001087 [Penicillium diatomitis]|uniref:Protein mms22 n=1 Tax=Penicillium diatomitis TaxID=2819901 RepID=A0A9X0C2Z2_9EURO|nr:uncharacterized protein N7539_001087 [Penicillium diatomitis]KAJ5495971.1 hypothetical protein N7539_001087 [Penicillium diatomitis]